MSVQKEYVSVVGNKLQMQMHGGASACLHCCKNPSMFFCKTPDCQNKYFCAMCIGVHPHPMPGLIAQVMEENMATGTQVYDQIFKGIEEITEHLNQLTEIFSPYKQVLEDIQPVEKTKIASFTQELEKFHQEAKNQNQSFLEIHANCDVYKFQDHVASQKEILVTPLMNLGRDLEKINLESIWEDYFKNLLSSKIEFSTLQSLKKDQRKEFEKHMVYAHVKHISDILHTLCKDKTKGKSEESLSSIQTLEDLRSALVTLKEQQTELRPMNFVDNKIQFLKDYKQSQLIAKQSQLIAEQDRKIKQLFDLIKSNLNINIDSIKDSSGPSSPKHDIIEPQQIMGEIGQEAE